MASIQEALGELIAPDGEFAITVEEIAGRRVRTFVDRPRHLAEIAARASGHAGEFLVGPSSRLTFEGTFDMARRLASRLRNDFGVAPGDRVAVVGANSPEWVVSYWAGILAEAIVVPLNAWWGPGELRVVLEDAAVGVVITDERRRSPILGAGHPEDAVITWLAAGLPEGVLRADAIGVEVDRRGEDEVAVLFYTSGTTGRPKGVALSHRNVIAGFLNAVAMTTAARRAASAASGGAAPIDTGESEGDTQIDLCVIPLFHATANLAIMVPFAAAGHTLVFLAPGRFDPEVAGELIERERITRIGGVPTIVSRFLDSRVWERRDLSSVRRVSYGGAPAASHLPRRVAEAFPAVEGSIVQGYGLTETTAITTLNQGVDYARRPGSVGIAAPTVELRIGDADGAPLPHGEEGEVMVRGSNVFAGYWNLPDQDPFTDGFFHTGDIGYLDGDGFLYITDRAKDVIVRGGENVASAEVEAVLDAHPAVLESGVVGVPDADLGEAVKAFVVVQSPVPDAAELSEFAADRLASYKVPTHWELRTEPLPRNPSGKVLKARLRGTDSAVFTSAEDSAL
jgi:long-chain acyl-CoA synthetase